MRQCEDRVRSVKEMRPHDEKLTQTMTETRLGIGVGKGLRGQQGHMLESLARGCMAAEWEGGLGKGMHGGGERWWGGERGGVEGARRGKWRPDA